MNTGSLAFWWGLWCGGVVEVSLRLGFDDRFRLPRDSRRRMRCIKSEAHGLFGMPNTQ